MIIHPLDKLKKKLKNYSTLMRNIKIDISKSIKIVGFIELNVNYKKIHVIL